MDADLITQVRALVGDTDSQWFTDDEITSYLTVYASNVLRAAGAACQNLALNMAMTARSVKTDDLAIDNRTRATALTELSKTYFAQADSQDAKGANDFFEIVSFGGLVDCFIEPDAAADFYPDPSNPGYLIV